MRQKLMVLFLFALAILVIGPSACASPTDPAPTRFAPRDRNPQPQPVFRSRLDTTSGKDSSTTL